MQCRDPSVKENRDTLMPVRPREQNTSGGLSHNGETVEAQNLGMEEGEVAQIVAENGSEGDDDEEDEVKEGRVAIGRKSPTDPTNKEMEEHELTHTPFRSWCEHCVKPRARNAHHRQRAPEDPLEEVKVPRVHMDYFFMSRKDESASSNPLLVVADERTGARYARAVGQKGLGEAGGMDWLIKDMSNTMKAWGHAGGTGGEVILKSDGEPALLAVKNAGEKAENGLIEEAG